MSPHTREKKKLSRNCAEFGVRALISVTNDLVAPPLPSHVFYVETARCQTRGSRRSTGRMLTSGGTDARGRFTESSAGWGGRGRPLTPVEAISDSSYLVYGGAGRGLPYTKYEGPNHALSGVSGCARPLHSADKFVHLPRAFMPPGVRWRGRTGAAGGGGSGDFSHVFCMTEARLGPPPYKTYETPTM